MVDAGCYPVAHAGVLVVPGGGLVDLADGSVAVADG